MNRQNSLRLFSVIAAFAINVLIAHAVPPAPDGPGPHPIIKGLLWTIPESEASYPALLMPKDHERLNIVAYLKQTESQALAKFASQGYVKASPDKAATLEKELQTNLGMRLDVAGKIITGAANTPIAGARYVVVERQKEKLPSVNKGGTPKQATAK